MTAPTYSQAPPSFRTVVLAVGRLVQLAYTKDPREAAWYMFTHQEQLKAILDVEITGPNTQLLMEASLITPDKSSVVLFLSGGTTNTTYRVTLGMQTQTDQLIYNTATINVVTAGSTALPTTAAPTLIASSSSPQGTIMAAQADIAAGMALMFASGGGVVPADPSSTTYLFAGVAAQAALSGSPVPVVEAGKLTVSSWTWVGSSALTQTVTTPQYYSG